MEKANLTESDLSAVAVTIGPGLSLCLRGNFAGFPPYGLIPKLYSVYYVHIFPLMQKHRFILLLLTAKQICKL